MIAVRTTTATLLVVLAAAVVPARDVVGPDAARGSIGVTTPVSACSHGCRCEPATVFFGRLDAESNDVRAIEVVPSNYKKGDQFFLLNAQPGRWVVVGAYVEAAGQSGLGENPSMGGAVPSICRSLALFLPRRILAATEVVVEPGGFEFAGELLLAQAEPLRDARQRPRDEYVDSDEWHHAELVFEGRSRDAVFAKRSGALELYTVEPDEPRRDPKTIGRFWSRTRKAFGKQAAWTAVIESARVEEQE